MKTAIVYGRGAFFKAHRDSMPDAIKIVAWGNSDPGQATSHNGILVEGLEVLSPEEVKAREDDVDLIVVGTDVPYAIQISKILSDVGVSSSKVRYLWMYSWSQSVDVELIISGDDAILSFNKIKIKLSSETDAWCCREVFVDKCYSINIPHPHSIVVDIGMNVGTASLFFASSPNVDAVYGYEPFPDTYKSALENYALSEKSISGKIHPNNFAISNFDGTVEIPVSTELRGCRTTEIEMLKNVSTSRSEQIEYRRADTVIKQILDENPGKRLILKIDTEGSEFEIFDSLKDTDILTHVDSIAMEYHRKPDELMRILEKFGFRYIRTGRDEIGMIYAFNMDLK